MSAFGMVDDWVFVLSYTYMALSTMFKSFWEHFSDNVFIMFPIIALVVVVGVLAVFRVVSS